MVYKINLDFENQNLIKDVKVISNCLSIVGNYDLGNELILQTLNDTCDPTAIIEIELINGEKASYPLKLCVNNYSCTNCSECIDNVCIDVCKEEEVCFQNTCVDCITSDDCPNNQICSNTECICPPNTTKDNQGICQENIDTNCLPCHVFNAITNKCEPLNCLTTDPNDYNQDELQNLFGCFDIIPERFCSEVLNKCVECLQDSHCPDPNTYCLQGKCVGRPGYFKDLSTGLYVENLGTVNNCQDGFTECPECTTCFENSCIPLNCPEGQLCYQNSCVNTCSQDSDCPQGYKCVNVNNINICVFDNPNNPINPDDITTYVPDNPNDVIINPENEIPVPGCLSLKCNTLDDCGLGCGCLNGQCVPCNLLSCNSSVNQTNSCSNVPGCECNNNSNLCEADPSLACKDNLVLTQQGCSLTGTFNSQLGCQCEQNTVTYKVFSNSNKDLEITGILKNSAGINLSNVAINATPTLGILNIKVRYVAINTSSSLTTTETVFNQNISFSNVDNFSTIINSSLLPDIGTKVIKNNVEFTVSLFEIFINDIPNKQEVNYPNLCKEVFAAKYIAIGSFKFLENNLSVDYSPINMIRIYSGNRLPLLTIKSSINSLNFSVVKSEYTNTINLDYPDLKVNKYYSLESDCGCSNPVYLACNNINTEVVNNSVKLTICELQNVNIAYGNSCGTSVIFSQDVIINCLANRNAALYQLIFNKNYIANIRTAPANGLLYTTNEVFTHTEPITSVEIALANDFCSDCLIELNLIPSYLVIDNFSINPLVCNVGELTPLSISVSNNLGNTLAPHTAELYYNNNLINTYTFTNTTVEFIPALAGSYYVKIIDNDGCEVISNVINYLPTITQPTNVVIEGKCGSNNTSSSIKIKNNSTQIIEFTITSSDAPSVNISGEILANLEYVNNNLPVLALATYQVSYKVKNSNCNPVIKNVTISCCAGVFIPDQNIQYSCVNGLVLNNDPTITVQVFDDVLQDYVLATNNLVLPPGNRAFRLIKNICTKIQIIEIPQCYECINASCVPVNVNNNLGLSLQACNNQCVCQTTFNSGTSINLATCI